MAFLQVYRSYFSVSGSSFPVKLELIIAGCGILARRNAGMDLHLGDRKLLIQVPLMLFFWCLTTPVVLVHCF